MRKNKPQRRKERKGEYRKNSAFFASCMVVACADAAQQLKNMDFDRASMARRLPDEQLDQLTDR